MRELVLKMSMSVDGFVSGPKGEMGWAVRAAHPEGKAWVAETVQGAGALLVGRGLYTEWVAYWPTSPDPIAGPMNAIPKIAFSRSGELGADVPTAEGWEDTRVLGTDLAADIENLKSEQGDYLLLQGGVSIARSLIGLGLVDEYRLVVSPVVLGSGQALFEGAGEFDLELVDAVTFPTGTQALTYRPK